MKRRHSLRKGVIIFATILAVVSSNILPVSAGSSQLIIDDTSYVEEISMGTWANPDSKVTVEDKNILFPDDSTDSTRLITKTAARVSAMHDVVIAAKATIHFEKLPKNQEFVLALGLSSIEGLPGDNGNIEIRFKNEGGVKATVVVQEDGETKEIIPQFSCGKMRSGIAVDVSVTKDSILTLKIGGKVVGKSKIPVQGEGRVGFLQTGSCVVKVSDVNIVSYRYDTPENSDIFEDFEKKAINTNLLTSNMNSFVLDYAPSYAVVEELDGNQVFMCKNTGEVYLGTLYKYSNFEISFDVPYLQRMAERNEEGEIIIPQTAPFLIAWGSTEQDPKFATGYNAAEQKMVFYPSGGGMICPLNYDHYAVYPENYPFFDVGCDRGFSVKMCVIDGVTTVYMKWIDETKWTEILRCNLGTNTPMGYVQLWVQGVTNMAIDNLRIINKDEEANLIDIKPEYYYMQTAEDYEYVKEKNVYKDFTEQTGEKNDFNRYYLIPITVGVCILILGAEILVLTLKRKRGGKKSVE